MKVCRLIIFVVIFSSFLVLVQPLVFAHGGKTDYMGGHTNHSTGEYHYHHGYSAHQHENGVCPYEFKDNTNHDYQTDKSQDNYKYNTSTNNNKTEVYNNTSYTTKEDSKNTIKNDTKNIKKSISFWDVLKAMLTELIPAVALGFFGSYFLSYIWLLIFGEEKGCSITLVSAAVLSVGSYIYLIYIKLT